MSDREGGARNWFAPRRVANQCCEGDESGREGIGEYRRAWRYRAMLSMLALLLLVASPARPQSADNPDDDASAGRAAHKVRYSFVFMGCNRILKGDKSPENPSTANLAQLERSFTEIAALKPRPDFVVFTGDLVLGLTPDLNELRHQLASWINVYLNSDLGRDRKIRLIAMPGNHESLFGEKGSQQSNPGAEAVWLSLMQPFIAGNNGPPAGGPDNLQTDQSQLTYSFDFRDSHFVLLNTDPYGAVATVPLNWLHADLAAASSDPHLKHTFVLGHKQAFSPPDSSSEEALDSHPDLRNQFWDELNNAGVGYYLVAHAHLWHFGFPISPISMSQHTVQIIAGNGGSKEDPIWDKAGKPFYYGFTLVQVLKDGEVLMKSYGRDFDRTNYLAPSPPAIFPTTIRLTLDFLPGY
jgi:calcineurin-like phosphoesterase family protein